MDVVSAAWSAGLTITVIFAVLVGIGFFMLVRRTRSSASDGREQLDALLRRAKIQLVRADDAVAIAEEELGYALAQFGSDRAGQFERTLGDARQQLREAFQLQQKLDDSTPDTDAERRAWGARIVLLCESAQSALAEQKATFDALRAHEQDAPRSLRALHELIAATRSRRADAESALASLRAMYAASAIAAVTDNLDRADDELAEAARAAGTAENLIAGPTTPAADAIRSGEAHAGRAAHFLDAITTLAGELATARKAVATLEAATRDNLAEARALRDTPPDAAAADAIARGIRKVEQALITHGEPLDPLARLERLRAANAELDASLADARNQQRRLEGARTALAGALVTARSQISATRDFINTRRAGIGPEARTRLAEAERLLTIAEAEADPVTALDTARSSATYSRDADALARYDLIGR